MSRLDERGIAILPEWVGCNIAPGFGFDFSGCFFPVGHGLDEATVDVVFARAECLAIRLDGIFELSETGLEASGAEPKVFLGALVHGGLATDKRFGNLEAFGPLLGALGGLHALKSHTGEKGSGGEFGNHRGGECRGFLIGVAIVDLDGETKGVDSLVGRPSIVPDGGAFDGSVATPSGVFQGRGNTVADFVGEGVLGENLEELSSGDNDVFVTSRGGVAVHLLQRHGGALRVFRLSSGELSGGSDESKDLFVFPIELSELFHELRSGGGSFGCFLELGLQIGAPISMGRQTEGENEGEVGKWCFQNPAFLSAPTILLASEAISLSG